MQVRFLQYTCIHTYIHTYLRTYVPMYIHTHIPTYMHAYIHTCIIHTYTHRYLYIYTHNMCMYIYIYIHDPCCEEQTTQLKLRRGIVCTFWQGFSTILPCVLVGTCMENATRKGQANKRMALAEPMLSNRPLYS